MGGVAGIVSLQPAFSAPLCISARRSDARSPIAGVSKHCTSTVACTLALETGLGMNEMAGLNPHEPSCGSCRYLSKWAESGQATLLYILNVHCIL